MNPQAMMDLLGSIMGSMDKPPTASEREKKMQKGGRLLVASRERAGEAWLARRGAFYVSTALQQRAEKRLEAEQKRRAKFRTEVNGVRKQIATGVRSFPLVLHRSKKR